MSPTIPFLSLALLALTAGLPIVAPQRIPTTPDPLPTVSSGGVVSGGGVSGGVVSGGGVSGLIRPNAAARWGWPLHPQPVVLRRFLAPATAYGPGHRGIDVAAIAGQEVLAVADGRVSHVGVVGGRATLSITHAGGLRSTYEPVTATVAVGMQVGRGQRVGSVAAGGGHCGEPAPRCLHLGALRGRAYLDPLSLLARAPVVLLPLG